MTNGRFTYLETEQLLCKKKKKTNVKLRIREDNIYIIMQFIIQMKKSAHRLFIALQFVVCFLHADFCLTKYIFRTHFFLPHMCEN